ncbi:MAG: hypothetical protein ACXAEI_10735 [Candidatus Hodarchaeales archaeon]|jgi:hypothetical protein
MLDIRSLVRRKRAVSSGVAAILLIGLTVPAATVAYFFVLPMMADGANGTTAEDVNLSKMNGLANVISGSAIDISIQNNGEDRITINATKIRCANGTEFLCSSWRTPWYPEDGIVEAGQARTFTFVFDEHPAEYGVGPLQLIIRFYVDDDISDNFEKTIVISMTGTTAAGDVDLSKINELANVISGSAVDIRIQNSGDARITINATKIRCANGTEFLCSSWRTPWYPKDGVIEVCQARIFTFVFDEHPAGYGAGTLQLIITFYISDDPCDTFVKTIVIAS